MSRLQQMREGIEQIINADKDIGIVARNATVDNGRDVPMPAGNPSEHKIICRVSYQSGGVWSSKPHEAGLTIDTTPFVLSRFDADIKQGDTLAWRSRNYTVGVVTRPEFDGGFTCAQAPLVLVSG